MKKEYKKLIQAHYNLQSAIEGMEAAIVNKVELEDFSIFWQPSDGFVLRYERYNAPLGKCLSIILSKGKLTLEDYLDNTI